MNEHTCRVIIQLNVFDSQLQSGSHEFDLQWMVKVVKPAKNDKLLFYRRCTYKSHIHIERRPNQEYGQPVGDSTPDPLVLNVTGDMGE